MIAELIKELRSYNQQTQTALAEASGLSKRVISAIESKKRYPTISEFLAIDKAFDGDLYWALTENNYGGLATEPTIQEFFCIDKAFDGDLYWAIRDKK